MNVGPLKCTRETCRRCGAVSPIGFTVPDNVWLAVTDLHGGPDTVWCLRCFTTIGDELLIPWDRDIQFWPVSMASVIHLHHRGVPCGDELWEGQ